MRWACSTAGEFPEARVEEEFGRRGSLRQQGYGENLIEVSRRALLLLIFGYHNSIYSFFHHSLPGGLLFQCTYFVYSFDLKGECLAWVGVAGIQPWQIEGKETAVFLFCRFSNEVLSRAYGLDREFQRCRLLRVSFS